MSVFKFKEFSIIQEDSAMKVGTDGVLLGAWASCENQNTILDVGCGTGLITLMLAQRNNNSSITGIDIDKAASKEAQLNTNNSDWEERITIKNSSLQDFYYKEKFDLIVSNPPFFACNESIQRRDVARRTNSLSFRQLIQYSAGLLAESGILSVIIPKESETDFSSIVEDYNLYCNRACYIKGNETSKVKRVMMEFTFFKSKTQTEFLTIERSRHQYTKKYIELCKDFYLNMK